MQDRPTAVELLQAAEDFCERELGPSLTGRMRFQVRVLQNLLGILRREWEGEEEALGAELERLRLLLGTDDERPSSFAALQERVKELNADLSRRIRAGDLDDRSDEVRLALYDTIREKLAIANPRYASSATSAGASVRSTR
jgi:hypothetical protein